MKIKFTKRAIFGILASCIMGLSAGEADAQTFTNTGTGKYNATCGAVIRLKASGTDAAITTTGTVPIGTTEGSAIPGVVEYTRANGDQTVKAYYYNQLVLSGASTKTVPTGIFVLGTQCPDFLTGYDQLATYPYYIAAASGGVTYEDGSTFNYAGTSDQNIFPDQYQTIAIAGAGNAVVPAGETVEAENITSEADAPILVDGTLNLTTGVSAIQGSLTLADAGIMTTGAGNVTVDGTVSSEGAITTGAGTVDFTGDVSLAGDATIQTGDGAVTFTNAGTLDLAGTSAITTGAGNVEANGPVTTADGTTVTVGSTGNLTFGGTLALDGDLVNNGGGAVGATGDVNFDAETTIGATGTITLGTNAQLYISDVISNDGDGTNLAFDCSSNVFYDGGVQTIMPTVASNPYGNLDLSGAGLKTGGTEAYGADISICKNFDLSDGNLTMLTNGGTLIMTDPTVNPTYAAMEEVVGNMQRTTNTDAHTLVFNNSATSIALGADADNPTSMTLGVQPGTNPNDYDNVSDVNRKITLSYAGGTGSEFAMTAQAGYLYGEGPGGWAGLYTQNSIRMYEADNSPDREKVGTGQAPVRVAAVDGVSFGTISLAGILNTGTIAVPNDIDKFASGNDLLLAAGPTTFYTRNDGRWTNPNTWDEGTIPSDIDNAELRHTVYVGIDGGFISTGGGADDTPANNTRSEFAHYAAVAGDGDAAAVNNIVIKNKADFPTNNPALIVGNEDNPDTYIFKTSLTGTITNENTAANNATRATWGALETKANLQAGDIQGVWIVPYTTAGKIPGLGTNAVSNAGEFNNQGVLEIGN